MNNGTLIISLDFELYWGSFDTKSFDQYRLNIEGARRAIPMILDLFKKYEIHATWATVGYLFYEKKSELIEDLPQQRPQYTNSLHNSYLHLDQVGESEEADPYHFARSVIEVIKSTPAQEVSTHTFSHYYCLEPGQNESQFRDDLRAAKKAASRIDLDLKTLVFPRNQFNPSYLKICTEEGIQAIRGTETSWMHKARNRSEESFIHRGLRLIDTYINISGDHSYLPSPDAPINLPASRFLRPVSKKLRILETLRKNRIKKELSHAAKKGTHYHLWWHPHNFGTHTEENLKFLEDLLIHFKVLQRNYGFQSQTMLEASANIKR